MALHGNDHIPNSNPIANPYSNSNPYPYPLTLTLTLNSYTYLSPNHTPNRPIHFLSRLDNHARDPSRETLALTLTLALIRDLNP